jgi:glycosyltransferase involved in cell wall biosynthesis
MFLSVITPTLNSEATLGEALESVRCQWEEDMEHLVIDAVSRDSTLDVASLFPAVQVTSEPDKGIYDGMNKGAFRAKGEWLLFLQGDDWLPEGAIKAFREAVAAHPDADMLCGQAEAVRCVDGAWVPVWAVRNSGDRKLNVANIALGEPMINARLMRKSLFHALNGFCGEFDLASDRDFLIRAAQVGVIQSEVDAMTYRYRWHGGSSTMTDDNRLAARLLRENLEIASRHLSRTKGADASALRSWHGRLCIQSAMNALEDLDVRTFSSSALRGISRNPLWMFLLGVECLSSIPGFLKRGCRTRSQIKRRSRS